MNLKEFAQIKQQVEELKSQRDRTQGALEQLKKELKSKYGCSTIKEAKGLLATKKQELHDVEEKYQTVLQKFEEKYGEILSRDSE